MLPWLGFGRGIGRAGGREGGEGGGLGGLLTKSGPRQAWRCALVLRASTRRRTSRYRYWSCRVCSSDRFFSSRRRHTRCYRDWSSDVCSSDLDRVGLFSQLSNEGHKLATI